MTPPLEAVDQFLRQLRDDICQGLESLEPGARFRRDSWERPEGGGGESRVLDGGEVFERGGVNFSRVHGKGLPPSATARNPQLAGREFTATGVSLVIHPRNPHVPTTHANVRYFQAGDIWWFGGGFDLTPYYPVHEDVLHWHRCALDAVGPERYPIFKQACDEYFYLPHRQETRGIGGLFYDDYDAGGFDAAFDLTRAVGETFLAAYLPIVERRKDTPFSQTQRDFQLYRRGRYVEFNLIYDRGTLFGLQSGGRTESILMSMPPLARWDYNWSPPPGSDEAVLYDYLRPREWLA